MLVALALIIACVLYNVQWVEHMRISLSDLYSVRTLKKKRPPAVHVVSIDRPVRATRYPSQSQTPRSFYTDLGRWISFWSWHGVRPPLRAFRRNRAVCSDAPSSALSGPLRREVGRLRAGPIASSRAWRLRRCRSRIPDPLISRARRASLAGWGGSPPRLKHASC
jgi:hypothetical protein